MDLQEQVLASAWEVIRSTTPENVGSAYPAAQRAIDGGASATDLATACSAAACEAVFGLLFDLFSERVGEFEVDDLRGIHESLLSADPTEREGSDLFG